MSNVSISNEVNHLSAACKGKTIEVYCHTKTGSDNPILVGTVIQEVSPFKSTFLDYIPNKYVSSSFVKAYLLRNYIANVVIRDTEILLYR